MHGLVLIISCVSATLSNWEFVGTKWGSIGGPFAKCFPETLDHWLSQFTVLPESYLKMLQICCMLFSCLILSSMFVHWHETCCRLFNWQKTYRKVSKNATTKHIPIWQRRRLMWISGGRVSGDAWGLWPWRQKWHWDKTCIKVLSKH